MSDLESADARVAAWLQALDDESAPCGPDLEYDNDFLELTQAAAGKPETQVGDAVRAAEPPEWRRVHELSEELLGRSRDLRIAMHWVRALLHLQGYAALPVGLRLISGLLRERWDHLHPMPDPDDGDLYARVNTLTLLREHAGLVGDLRAAYVVRDRAIGELSVRAIELAAGLAQPLSSETAPPQEPQRLMLAAAVEKDPGLRDVAQQAAQELQALAAVLQERLGGDAPDLKPLRVLVGAVSALMPEAAEAAGDEAGEPGEAGAAAGSRRSLTGSVNSREDALRAIDLVCQYLERAEPSNPATLFLKRARHLVNHNFLQLLKELAPDSLSEVARIVGVDPDTVEAPSQP